MVRSRGSGDILPCIWHSILSPYLFSPLCVDLSSSQEEWPQAAPSLFPMACSPKGKGARILFLCLSPPAVPRPAPVSFYLCLSLIMDIRTQRRIWIGSASITCPPQDQLLGPRGRGHGVRIGSAPGYAFPSGAEGARL